MRALAIGCVVASGVAAVTHARAAGTPATWSYQYGSYCTTNCDGTPVPCGTTGSGYPTCEAAAEQVTTIYQACIVGGATSPYCGPGTDTFRYVWTLAPWGSWSASAWATASCPAGDAIFPTSKVPAQFLCCPPKSTWSWATETCDCDAGTIEVAGRCVAGTKAVGPGCPNCSTPNPIYPGTGNKLLIESDYSGSGPFPLAFDRVYNSAPQPSSPFMVVATHRGIGANWTHPYHRRLSFIGPTNKVVAERPDGKAYAFQWNGSSYASDANVVDRLEKAGIQFKLTTGADESELYDDKGRLLSITQSSGLAQTLGYYTPSFACTGACSVALMLHMDGSNGSTAFVDSSPSRHYVTAFGAAVIDTSQAKIGVASGSFQGTSGNRITFAPSADFEMTGDYTIEGWFRFSNTSAIRRTNGTNGHLEFHTNGNVYYSPEGATFYNLGSYAANTWIHLAASRSGTSLRMFKNGVLIRTENSAGTHGTSTSPYHLGWDGRYEGGNGTWIDDFRIVKGAALYTTSFTPPDQPLDPIPEEGKLKQVSDPFGRTLTFNYDLSGRIATITDPAGGQTLYGYSTDGRDNLTSVTYPDGATRIYHYENATYPSALTGVTDENAQRFATYAYDTSARAVLSEHAAGAERVTVAYPTSSTASVVSYVTNSVTATRAYGFQSVQGVPQNTSIAGPACPTCGPAARTYDANGNVASSTDWNGNRTNSTYELARNLETSRTEGLTAAGATTPLTRTTWAEWHPSMRVPSRLARPFHRTTFAYNGEGGAACGFQADGMTPVRGVVCSVKDEATTDATGASGFSATVTGTARVVSFTYDADGQVLTVDGARTNVSDVTSFAYYAANVTCAGASPVGCRGQVAATSDALGHVTHFDEYDANGRPLKIVDPNGAVLLLAYDARGRLKSRSVAGMVTAFTYDGAGQITRVTLPNGSFFDFAYDAAHRLTELTDSAGNRIVYTLDWAGNRVQEDVYDASSALTRTRKRVFSNASRLLQTIGAQNQTTTFAYDGEGNVTSVTDPLNRTTTRVFDGLHRLVKVLDAAAPAGTTLLDYDANDRLVKVTDPRGLATLYAYDGFDALTQTTSPDTGVTTNVYDAAGTLVSRTDAKGQKTDFTYDALDRLTLAKYADGSEAAYEYDTAANGVGRLGTVTDASGIRTFDYDSVGHIISTSMTAPGGAAPLTIGYTYDGAGFRKQMTYPSGRVVDFARDSLGRISRVQTTAAAGTTTLADAITYQPFGPLKSFTTQTGATASRTFDLDGRIASYTAAGKTWAITYDSASQITKVADAANVTDARTYAYDVLGRLVGATTPAGSETFTYDAVGNRLTRDAAGVVQTLGYGAADNRLMSTSAPDARTYVYDANGSPTSDGTRDYTYDARGRLVHVVRGSVTADYVVGANGARVMKTVTR